jgi:hypothetical protein
MVLSTLQWWLKGGDQQEVFTREFSSSSGEVSITIKKKKNPLGPIFGHRTWEQVKSILKVRVDSHGNH